MTTSVPLPESYDYRLVGASVALATVVAASAIHIAQRVTIAHGRAKYFRLAGGAISLGIGLCAMHYVGMLADRLSVPVLYQYPTALFSLLMGMGVSAVALFTVSRQKMTPRALIIASVIMGAAFSAMHYIGMSATRMPASIFYRNGSLALSVALSMLFSGIALKFIFRARGEQVALSRKIGGALLAGAAICLVHYSGMLEGTPYAGTASFSTPHAVSISLLGIVLISAAGFLPVTAAFLPAFVDQILAMRKAFANAVRDGETQFRTLAEAIPQIVWTASPEGPTTYINQHWYELTGTPPGGDLGTGWIESVHPDDRQACHELWERCRLSGEPFQLEYRLRDAAKGYRWYLDRAVPLRDSSGAILQWFGTCTDINDQMENQQLLEQQVKEHTAALMEANIRLESEMRERALAQQELNQQNERMVRELTIRSNRATTLAKMAELLQSCAALTDVFSVVAGMGPKVFPDLRGAVLLFDSSRRMLEVVSHWSDCELPAALFEPQDCWALRTGHFHLVPAGDSTAKCGHVSPGNFSYFCVPLLSQGDAVGIVHFQRIGHEPLPDSEVSMASTFAEQVGLSVANIRLREALRSQSIRDPLTGLYNRRYLEEMLEREIRRSIRSELPLGVLMLDLDHFKQFNDTYGHEAGDTVLRETASLLTASVRAEDIVCRFGGEEFVVILPMADLKTTQARAERIRTKLRELNVLHQGQSLGKITASIGVAALPDHGTSPKPLLEAADSALYRAKREGRDRVAVATLSFATKS